MGQVGGGEVTGRVVEHFSVVCGVVGSILIMPGLVGSAEEGYLFRYEFFGGGRCESAVVGAGCGSGGQKALWMACC